MAERSFKQEVDKLRLGLGEEFRGEGILAVTKALLQCGVGKTARFEFREIGIDRCIEIEQTTINKNI